MNNVTPEEELQDVVEILVVEDSVTQALQLQRMLERNGYKVTVAHNGVQALEMLHHHPVTIVLTDILMPEMDGYALCKCIKADMRLKDIPVILLTALSDPMDILKGLQCGADNFIVKPYDAKILLYRIHYILANRALRRHASAQMGLEVYFGGAKHMITSERVQIVDLLLSVYETAVQKNGALQQAKDEAELAQIAAEVAHKEAETARTEAEIANTAKSEFLSRMSHELRTPLNAILGFAQVMEMENTDPQHSEGLEQILSAGRHLLELINEVLDITRIEAGRMDLSLEPVSVEETLQEAVNLISPLANERKIQIKISGADGLFARADRQRLKQVFLNLLSNAVKYNTESGHVVINCELMANKQVRVKIADDGHSIMLEDRDKLFKPFERLSAAHSGVAGTGLGLALSKRLMEAMEGTIGLEEPTGTGNAFWIELPQAKDPVLQQQASDKFMTDHDDIRIEGPSRTVLYVEDNLSNLRLVEHILRHRPEIKLLSAMQGRLGLELARKHRPDLVLLDLHLPDIMGDEVLRQLRADETTRDIPVVMLSADASPTQIKRLKNEGAESYLTKPLDVQKFLGVLEEYLREKSE